MKRYRLISSRIIMRGGRNNISGVRLLKMKYSNRTPKTILLQKKNEDFLLTHVLLSYYHQTSCYWGSPKPLFLVNNSCFDTSNYEALEISHTILAWMIQEHKHVYNMLFQYKTIGSEYMSTSLILLSLAQGVR